MDDEALARQWALEEGGEAARIDFGDDADGAEPAPSFAGVIVERAAATLGAVFEEAPTPPQQFRRRRAYLSDAAAVPPPSAPAQRLADTVAQASSRYDELAEAAARRCAPRVERLYQCRGTIARLLCALIVAALVAAAALSYFADPHAYVVETARPAYARHGVAGVNLSVAVSELTCDDVARGRVDELRASARYLLAHDALECVCAPMLGWARRYALVRAGSVLVDLFNARLDGAWDGVVDENVRLDAEARSLLTEDQRMLFPLETAPARVVRRDAVRVVYRDAECRAESLVLRREHAWCMQACGDLFEGRSVYDVALVEE